MSNLSDKYCEGWCKESGGKGKFEDCAGCEIYALEAKLERVEKYMSDAWHHDSCPRYGGNDYPACTCGYTDLVEALEDNS